ncbi:MAG: glutamate ligase domain-containing protein, partial [Candidatus Limnocylindrales bacterium]
VMAAVAVGLLFGVAPDAIRRAVAAVRGVEHRLETVAGHERIRYGNDSQGTQPDAVIAALRSFRPPLVLIAGGRSKDLAIDELARVAVERATAVLLIGESTPDFERIFRAAGHGRVERCASLEAAVERATAIARHELANAAEGAVATVLLSPAAASFDMFADYAARGRAFRAAVEALVAGRPS